MPSLFMIGKKLVPAEHVALVEPYEPGANPRFHTSREFHSRIVLIDRDSILTEQSVEEFAQEHGFRMLREDGVATNPGIHFRVETFTPAEGFTPRKPYVTRLLWRDLDGNDQSKLLLSKPEVVLAVAVRGNSIQEHPPEDLLYSGKRPRSIARRRTRQRASAPTV